MPEQALIVVSNGHGEDMIGTALAQALAALGVSPVALPLVGRGKAYENADIELAGPRQDMPSGGFVFDRPSALRKDLRAGFLQMTLKQYAGLHRLSRRSVATLVVGDWYGLSVGSFLGSRPLFQMQPLVSLRTWQGVGAPVKGSPYGPWERHLMGRALRVFPRDEESAVWLRQNGVEHAICLGNPMLDAIYGDTPLDLPTPYLLLLPGSRADAYESLPVMLETCRYLTSTGLTPVIAWAGLPLGPLHLPNWRLEQVGDKGVTHCLKHADGTSAFLTQGSFRPALLGAKLALSTSGTAAEQAAGYGVPLVGFATSGPQFTHPFALGQKRLLREAFTLTKAQAEAVAGAVKGLLSCSETYHCAQQAGKAAMGSPGASGRIARAIARWVSSRAN